MRDRIKHAWNAFTKEPSLNMGHGPSSSRAPHKTTTFFNTSSYISSIYNRIAIDVSTTSFRHVKINPENEDMEEMKSGLNNCLKVEANIDQNHIQFIHDMVYSMFDEGVVAVVPVETTIDPEQGSFDIGTLRVGRIVNWFPKHVEVSLYNEETGMNENVIVSKKNTAIVENPLYAVLNDTNSTLRRLITKMKHLENMDSEDLSGRLDLLISVPYSVKSKVHKNLAEERIKDIEAQLATGRNGIAYIDGTEKAMQLNRPSHDQLPERIDRLNQQLYDLLGLTSNVLKGTASETELRTYYSRSIDPIIDTAIAEFVRKFITPTGRTQGQTIVAYRDMFKTVPVETIANLGDALRRNEIASSNEIRKWLKLKPSNDPRADQLSNPNIAGKNQTQDGTESDSTKIRLPDAKQRDNAKAEIDLKNQDNQGQL